MESLASTLLTSSTFAGMTNAGNANAASQPSLLARFRDLTGGGSDKVPGSFVPAPATAALAGLAGLIATRRRR